MASSLKNPARTWIEVTGTFKQLTNIIYQDGALYQNALGPVRAPTDPEYNDAAFWTAARDTAVGAGQMHPELSYPVTVTTVAKIS